MARGDEKSYPSTSPRCGRCAGDDVVLDQDLRVITERVAGAIEELEFSQLPASVMIKPGGLNTLLSTSRRNFTTKN